MSRTVALPTEHQVREDLAELTEEADSTGQRLTVIGLARRLGLANATFWRHFPGIAEEVSAAGRTPRTISSGASGPERYAELRKENVELRRTKTALSDHLALAVAHVQRLTLENHQLRQELEAAAKVTRIPTCTTP